MSYQLSWSQFDSMWTKLDTVRTGDLDLQELRTSSAIAEFEGTNTLTLHSGTRPCASSLNVSLRCVTPCATQLTVENVLLLTAMRWMSPHRILPSSANNHPSFDKSSSMRLSWSWTQIMIRQSTDSSMFVYRTWKMQLEEIDYRKSWLDPASNPQDAHLTNECKGTQPHTGSDQEKFQQAVARYS